MVAVVCGDKKQFLKAILKIVPGDILALSALALVYGNDELVPIRTKKMNEFLILACDCSGFKQKKDFIGLFN